jgi:hypothetical protein
MRFAYLIVQRSAALLASAQNYGAELGDATNSSPYRSTTP